MTDIYKAWKNQVSNELGHAFESAIEAACADYEKADIAKIAKTPEPFRVIKKEADGIFVGRFGRAAQPDFQGTLCNGRSFVMEAKSTSTDAMKHSVLTQPQVDDLNAHEKMGALCGVCVGIKDKAFFVPWKQWKELPTLLGKKSFNISDLAVYEVPYTWSLQFLHHYTSKEKKKDETD